MKTTRSTRTLLARLALMCAALVCAATSAEHMVEVAVSVQGGVEVDGLHSIPAPPTSTASGAAVDGERHPPSVAKPQSEARAEREHEQPHVQPARATIAKTSLTAELAALELMIQLQEKKLALLEKIRSKALTDSERGAPRDGDGISYTHRASAESFGELVERKIEAMTASAVQDLIASSGQQSSFDTLFVAKAMIQTHHKASVVDMKMMKLRAGGHQELLVVAFANNAIEFYLSPSLLLLRIELPSRFSIQSITLDLHSDSPSLVVVHKQSRVEVFALELTQNGRHLIGNQQANATSISVDSSRGFTSEPSSPYSFKVAELTSIQMLSPSSAHAITKTSRRSVLTIGSEDGSLRFVALNGTLLHQLATNASIRVMAAQRSLVAFNNDSDTVLLPLAKGREAAFVNCEGSIAQVTSIAFDPLHSDIVYAGTSHGEVLVYSATLESGSVNPAGACKMVARVLVRGASVHNYSRQPRATKVYTLKGYIIVSSGPSIVVYNVSRAHDGAVRLEVVCAVPAAYHSEGVSAGALPIAVSEGNFVTSVAFAFDYQSAANPGGVTVFQSLLASRVEKSDTSWTSMLYVGIIIAVVLVCQFSFRRQPKSQALPSAFEKWEAMKSRRPASAATPGGGGFRGGALFGVADSSGTGAYVQDASRDLEHLSQEMRASMDSRTARDLRDMARSKGGAAGSKMPSSEPLLSDRERFGPSYDALSDDLKRKIAEARQGTLECAFDDDDDDFEDEEDGEF